MTFPTLLPPRRRVALILGASLIGFALLDFLAVLPAESLHFATMSGPAMAVAGLCGGCLA